jgi:uncharacterized cupin superfamily protein
MRRFNVFTGELTDGGERAGFGWRGRRGIGVELGAERIGASLFEIPDGELSFPYHYHHGVEEWLYVLAGSPILRTPDGERTLASGDRVRFPTGPAGAHSVRGPGRLLMFSANQSPSISVYPDSQKIGTRPGDDRTDRLDFRRADSVDYWDGE